MKKTRHILNLSGGKDSTALALYMRDKVNDLEYIFCDTGKELPETYEYLNILEPILGKPIVRLFDERGFDHWLVIYGNYLPSSNNRWCTNMLKLRPFERYVGDDQVISYIGIRADEDREGYTSTKPNIRAVYPFKEDNIKFHDVHKILENHGLELPKYYKWRSRSGCYFCFYQQKIEWVRLKEHHPELFEEAKSYELLDPTTCIRYTWNENESLEELERPERVAEIKERHKKYQEISKIRNGLTLIEQFGNGPCNICVF